MSNNTYHLAKITTILAIPLLIFVGCGKSPTGNQPESISVSSSLIYLKIGEMIVISAEVLNQNHEPILDAALNWSSNNPEVVSISNEGVATAHSFGNAVLTVVSESKSSEVPVLVSDDLAALVSFYEATNGPFWRNRTNWLSSRPLHEWHGIYLNSNNRVERIELKTNLLNGGLPPLISDLVDLRSLILEWNNIRGELPPELGRLTKLQILALSQNNLGGRIPASLGDLRNLTHLGLGNNMLIGDIPSSLGNLNSLEYFFIDNNQLSGEIPPSLGNLEKLRSLYFQNNLLSGEIPSSLGKLSTVSYFDLSRNHLSGRIPPELSNLSSVTNLILSFNGLSGAIPPQFGNFSVLERMFLSNNQLTGSVPPGLGRLNRLWQLDLSFNRLLKGPLPQELTNLNLSALWIWGTGLCAPADLGFLEWLEELYKMNGTNAFTVPVCQEI